MDDRCSFIVKSTLEFLDNSLFFDVEHLLGSKGLKQTKIRDWAEYRNIDALISYYCLPLRKIYILRVKSTWLLDKRRFILVQAIGKKHKTYMYLYIISGQLKQTWGYPNFSLPKQALIELKDAYILCRRLHPGPAFFFFRKMVKFITLVNLTTCLLLINF